MEIRQEKFVMQDRDTLNPKAKKVKQVAWLIGTIQDLARDIEQDATRILVYKDKKTHLSEVKDGAEAILCYVADLEKLFGE